MTTYYTEIIENGGTFQDFVWKCTRAFTPKDVNPLCLVPSASDKTLDQQFLWAVNELERDEERLERLKAMTDLEWETDAQNKYDDDCQRYMSASKRAFETLTKYLGIKEQVLSWSPPTKDHQKLKDFMLKQIQEAVELDCGSVLVSDYLPQKVSGRDWKEQILSDAQESVERSKKRVEYWSQFKTVTPNWVMELAKSVPPPEELHQGKLSYSPNTTFTQPTHVKQSYPKHKQIDRSSTDKNTALIMLSMMFVSGVLLVFSSLDLMKPLFVIFVIGFVASFLYLFCILSNKTK